MIQRVVFEDFHIEEIVTTAAQTFPAFDGKTGSKPDIKIYSEWGWIVRAEA